MLTKMFWVAGVFLDVLRRCSGCGVFIDVYEDVLDCSGVSRCLRRCFGLLGCF